MNWRRFARQIRFTLYWPGLFLYFAGSHRSRVLVCYNDEILLIQDCTTYFYDELSWNLPGGGKQWREAMDAAAVREVKEELGIALDASELQQIGQTPSGNYGLRYTAHFFLAMCADKPDVTVDKHEVRTARWFRLTDVPDLPQKCEVTQALALLAARQ